MKIFEPITINGMELKNRMVVSAMVSNFCQEDGYPTEKFIAYHEKKAKGGWGLIITEDYAITPDAGGFKTLPGLWEDAQIDAHRELTNRVHKAGGKIVAQIYHAGRETCSEITGVHNVAPSAIKDPTVDEIPNELTIDEIHSLIESFGECARRVKEAGFDGVEVHGAHGYLIGQFVSPFSNKRFDEYGGDVVSRAKFAVDVVRKIREKCGEDFPVLYRMSSQEYVHGGLGLEETKVLARLLEEAGVNCIHCSQGVYASIASVIPPSVYPRACFIDNAAAIKNAVQIPVIGVGRINDPYVAESVLESGKADLCTMARASLADPDMPNKMLNGQYEDIIHCIGCLQGCIGENGKGNCIRCLVNPMTGMEDEYRITPVDSMKNILVAGGGVAGCEAAIVAAQRGHKVTIVEKETVLGGQWIDASVPVGKEEFTSFLKWQQHMIGKLGIKVLLNTAVTKELVEELKPDHVLVATGSIPGIPPVPGLREYGVTAHDILRNKKAAGHKVVVIGGGLVGAETADHLAEHGSKVTIIEMQPEIVKDGEATPTACLKERLDEFGVDVFTSAALQRVEADQVVYKMNDQEYMIDQVDTVVVATGVRPSNSLVEELKDCECKVDVIGDARKAKNGYLNIREGYEAGMNI